MKHDGMTVAIFRSQPDADDTAAQVRALGHQVVIAPSSQIEFFDLRPAEIPPDSVVLLTSRNAVRALQTSAFTEEHLNSLSGLCVGAETHRYASELKLGNVQIVPGTAADLAAACRPSDEQPCVYLRGRDISFDLADAVEGQIHGVIAYQVEDRKCWDPDEITALKSARAPVWLHLSPRQAISTIALAAHCDVPFGHPVRHICLSKRIADSLQAKATQMGCRLEESDVQVAATPQLQEILALLGPATAN